MNRMMKMPRTREEFQPAPKKFLNATDLLPARTIRAVRRALNIWGSLHILLLLQVKWWSEKQTQELVLLTSSNYWHKTGLHFRDTTATCLSFVKHLMQVTKIYQIPYNFVFNDALTIFWFFCKFFKTKNRIQRVRMCQVLHLTFKTKEKCRHSWAWKR